MNAMRSRVRMVLLLALFAGLFLVFPSRPAEAAFGISPPFLNADHLVAGITYEQTVYLVQDQPTTDLPIKAALSLPPEVASWISLDTGFDFTIPQGTRQFPVKISVRVPSGQEIGKWTGNLSFTSQPAQAGQVSIALGVNVAINMTVGNDIYEKFTVPLVQPLDIEEGWNPRVYVKFDNQGNVSEAFDAATFDLYDQYDAVRLAYMQKQDGFPATKPFSMNEYTVEFPTDFHLGIGEYWGNVVFYQGGKAVATQKAIFHVLPTGALTGTWGKVMSFFVNNLIGEGIALTVVILGVFFWVYRRRAKRPRRT